MPTRHRVNGGPAIVAFALFALLFILGLLFSTRPGMRVKTPAPPPPDESTVEGDGEWGDSGNAGSTQTPPRRRDSHKPW
jgi:hypothetical protein